MSFCEHFPSSYFASAVKATLKQQELTLIAVEPTIGQAKGWWEPAVI